MVRLLESRGYNVLPPMRERAHPQDFAVEEVEILAQVRPYSMVADVAIIETCRAVEHAIQNDIPGAIVECGVYRGGCMMAASLTLQRFGQTRDMYLFDTFEGMPPAQEVDYNFKGQQAQDMAKEIDDWAMASLDEVKANLAKVNCDESQLNFVVGKVEDTLPEHAPDSIAVLRLDTDWYSSTYHELVHLYPQLSRGGVLVIDDYGHWNGCREAVDQFIKEQNTPIFLARTNDSARVAIKAA